MLCLSVLGFALATFTQANNASLDTMPDTWAGIDALGRILPGYKECGPPMADRFVGMFYFLWREKTPSQQLYDLSKILQGDLTNPQFGPVGAFHWWGEPLFGYYLADDPWVIRKHSQMLSDAGVDVLIMDVTNALTYDTQWTALCTTFQQIRAEGGKTPQIAFIAHSGARQTVRHLYDRLYSHSLFENLWFKWKGKPLLLGPSAELDDTCKQFFTVRDSWAWTKGQAWFGDGHDRWPWLDHTPQGWGWDIDPNKPEEVSVAVAEHPVSNIGRSFHDGKEPSAPSSEQGLYFGEQWRRAREVGPEFAFVTGWNEWIAQRFINDGSTPFLGKPVKKGDTFFVDEYSPEYSRDIEPMRGGFGDDYYCQLVAEIRKFKGVRKEPKASAPKSIDVKKSFTQWLDVGPNYLDDHADTTPRDHEGWTGAGPYSDGTGRNDFQLCKVARDKKSVSFYVRVAAPLTQPQEPTWMTLLVGIGDDYSGWDGFQYAINRSLPSEGNTAIERNDGHGWSWSPIGKASIRWAGNELQIVIPREKLKLKLNSFKLRFKWIDHVPESGDPLDLYLHGDTAPNGRWAYVYDAE